VNGDTFSIQSRITHYVCLLFAVELQVLANYFCIGWVRSSHRSLIQAKMQVSSGWVRKKWPVSHSAT